MTLTETQAREKATSFANDALKGKKFRDASGKEHHYPQLTPSDWTSAEKKPERWRLGITPPAGVTVVVSFQHDGSDPQLEEAYFAQE